MKRLEDEQGAVLMLTALLIVIIVVFVAFAIDFNRTFASKSQQRHTAEYLSLAALEKYLQERDGVGHNAAVDLAVSRVEEIAGLNFLLAKAGQSQAHAGEMGRDATVGEAGRIIPGRWWFDEPPGGCTAALPSPCPCAGGIWSGACLQENVPAGEAINAFRVELKTQSTEPILNFFARVIGFNTQEIKSKATASLVPRHGLFLIDLSRSTQFESHIQCPSPDNPSCLADPPLGGDGTAEYAYRLIKSHSSCGVNKCTCGAGVSVGVGREEDPCLDVNIPVPGDAPNSGGPLCKFVSSQQPFYHGNGSPDNPRAQLKRNRGSSTSTTRHFRDDYSCYVIEVDTDTDGVVDGAGSISTSQEHYIIDTVNQPEPLNTILSGIHEAVVALERRQVSGDLAGAMGFDEFTNVLSRRFFLSPPGSTDFNNLKLLTENSAAGYDKRIRSLFFPRRVGPGGQGAQTDIALALADARAELLDPARVSESAEKFVVLFSDGLSSCDAPGSCGDTLDKHSRSIQRVANEIAEYQRLGIHLHTFLLGSLVSPHEMLSASPTTGKCMKNNEARDLASKDFGNGKISMFSNPFFCGRFDFLGDLQTIGASCPAYANTFSAPTAAAPFLYPNIFWQFSSITGGNWAPIRPCCKDGSGNCVSDASVQNALDAACGTATAGDADDNGMPNPVVFPPYTDAEGRLLCDPLGRDKLTQVRQNINAITDQSPFVLVE